MKLWKRSGFGWAAAVVGAVLLASPLLLRVFVVEAFKIPAGSMLPTLEVGDQIFVHKTDATPERGAVMVFMVPIEPYEDYIKRVVAVGGDEVEVRSGVVSINGEELPRRALGRETFYDRDARARRWYPFEADVFEETNGDHTYRILADPLEQQQAMDFGPVVVPRGHVFCLGDNRDHSYDSRAWGPVPEENLVGRPSIIWFSSGPDGMRSERVFEDVR